MVRRRRRGWPSRDVSCLASPSSTTPFLLRVRDSRAHLLSLRRATTPSPREGRPRLAHHAATKPTQTSRDENTLRSVRCEVLLYEERLSGLGVRLSSSWGRPKTGRGREVSSSCRTETFQ